MVNFKEFLLLSGLVAGLAAAGAAILTAIKKKKKAANSVSPNDKILVTGESYNMGNTAQGATYVYDETTKKMVSATNDAGEFGGLAEYFGGDNEGENIVDTEKDESQTLSRKDFKNTDIPFGISSGLESAADAFETDEEVKNSLKTTKTTMTGKEYLAQQAKAAKYAEQAQKAVQAAQDFKDEQNTSHNGGSYSQDTGEDMGGGMP